MRIAVIAFDTRGGVQPYVALSLGLQDAGHAVTMITTAGFGDLVTGYGVPLAEKLGVPHRFTSVALRTTFGGITTRVRRELGLPRRSAPVGAVSPVVYGFSPAVIPPPPKWGPERKITGYWTLPAAPRAAVPARSGPGSG